MYGVVLLIVLELSILGLIFSLMKNRRKYLHAASINLARIPVLPFGIYAADSMPTVVSLMFCMFAVYPIASSLDVGIENNSWSATIYLLALGVVFFVALRIWINKFGASQCYWLRIEDSNILGLNKKGTVLFTVPISNVKAIKTCWINRIQSSGKWSSIIKELYIAILLHEKVYIPEDLGYYKTAEAFADRYMPIIHTPEALQLLQQAFDVPVIDESQN